MVNVQLIIGNFVITLGALAVGFGFAQKELVKVNMGILAIILGIALLYSSVAKKLSDKNTFSLISNSFYSALGIIFAIVSLWTDEKLVIRTMASSVLVVSAITLNLSNYD